jgi:5-methylcytosine-specific restriction endonuclease McrBC GTP-binding regulatory subunit McrB
MPKPSIPGKRALSEEEVRSMLKTQLPDYVCAAMERFKNSLLNFDRDFNQAVSDPDNFPSLTRLEKLWGIFESEAVRIVAESFRKMMATIDERPLIRKKK